MSIAELGSLGEFIASIGVVVTLIFLTLQLRQNTKALRATSFQEINQDQIRLTGDAWRFWDLLKNAGDQPLQGADRSKTAEFLYNAFRSYETAWYQNRAGNLEAAAFEGHRRWMIWGLGNPTGIRAWDEMKSLFHPEFCEFVAELRAELSWDDHPCARIIADDSFFETLGWVESESPGALAEPRQGR